MKFNLKRTISIIISCVCIFTSIIPIHAHDFVAEQYAIPMVITTTQDERDQIFAETMAAIIPENEINGPQYHYGYEPLPYEYITLSGFAGNQVAGGYQFPTGGGFYFSDSGGPEVSGSINLSLPSPYDWISVSVNLGQRSETSGLFVTVPNKTDYFKLFVSKVVEVRPYIVTRKRAGTDNWEFYSAGSVHITYSVSASAKKVG